MLRYGLVLAVMLLAACASEPELPPTDTIVAVKPLDSGIVASSEKYSYRFIRSGVPQEYQRYQAFYARFQQQASGVRVNFVVQQHEVTAEYLVVMDKRRLSAGQQAELTGQYQAVPIDNAHLGVLFKATGFWTDAYAPELAAPYRLARPVVVSIGDKTQTLSTLGTLAIIPLAPLLPLVMMYGCAKGPCV